MVFSIFQFFKFSFIIINIQRIFSMSQRGQHYERSRQISRSPARTENRDLRTQKLSYRPETQRQILHHESPIKYDIDFYQRKVNRLENDLSALQDQLSLTQFRLKKAQDCQIKYEKLFTENQHLLNENDHLINENNLRKKQNDTFRDKLAQAQLRIKTINKDLLIQKQLVEQLRRKKQEQKQKVSSQSANEKDSVIGYFQKQIQALKRQSKEKENKLKDQIIAAKAEITSKQNNEESLSFKIEKIKADKNQEINRLKDTINQLRTQLTKTLKSTDQKLTDNRTILIQQTQHRIQHVTQLTHTIEQALITQIKNLNEVIKKKDAQITFLLAADKRFMLQNEQIQNGLKQHINRLQDKIFIIQRQNEIEIFNTIERLKKQYDQTINDLQNDMDRVKESYQQKINSNQNQITNLKRENNLLNRQNKKMEQEHTDLAKKKQQQINMLSQRIINIEEAKDTDLKNYTTSMRVIQDDAKTKLNDLHTAIQSKNTQFQILNAQLALKNEQITYLLNETNNLRSTNRQKLRSLETTNALEQNTLNDMISSYKKQILELKRRIHELQQEIEDKQAQSQINMTLLREDLNLQKQANQKLKSKNSFLIEWCKELEGDLNKQRIGNVNILHDQSVSRRQTVQIRQQVRVELQAIKEKEVEQIRNIFKLEKGRLESDLSAKQHQLRDKKAELSRLLVQYKNLQKKVGKSSKFDKGSQQNGKCLATLEAEILLTQNIFNAINKP